MWSYSLYSNINITRAHMYDEQLKLRADNH